MFSIIHRIVFVFNSLAILALLASYLAPWMSPELFWPIAFLGLAYPALIILNILFIVYWLIFFKVKFLFSLAAIIIGWVYVPRYIQFKAKNLPVKDESCLTIMTFNAHYFQTDDRKTPDADLFFEKLNKIDPDILCFQEMATTVNVPRNIIAQRFEKEYKKFYVSNISSMRSGKWVVDNIGILSRYPIINKGIAERNQESGNYSIYADIVKGKDTIRVVSTHLKSIRFVKKEYQAMETLREGDSLDIRGYKRIASKLKYAFLMRAQQAEELHEFIQQSPYKVIVCGDFNDSPLSYSYKILRSQLKDAFEEAGSGLGRTYVGTMPSFRIDYILGDPSFQFYNYYSKAFDFSDHKMVSCTIKLR